MTVLFGAPVIRAHETDQFSMPINRQFADYGPLLNRWMYEQMRRGVTRQNVKIRRAIDANKDARTIAKLQSPEEITKAVWKEYPVAYVLIENLEKLSEDKDLKKRFPGQVIGDRPEVRNVRQHFEIPYNPLRPWYAATINVYGVHLGTDKIGHFADMGMHYWRGYKKAIASGKSEPDAIGEGFRIATHGLLYSERGLMGYLTAGAYSNADLVGNFMGFLFYRNLTESIALKGADRPPLLVRAGEYWTLAPHVRRDSDFFSLFICEHLDEALNPSLYVRIFRPRLRMGVHERADKMMQRHADRHGNRRPPSWFHNRQKEFTTYYGLDYGHHGDAEDFVSIANTCFDPFIPSADVKSRDNMGMTPLHRAAWEGRADDVRALLGRGADAGARVRSNEAYSSEWGATPLHLAAGQGRDEVVTLLLDAGADVNALDDRGSAPLHRAVDHPTTVQLLLTRGADAKARDASGRSALHWASDAPGDVYDGDALDPTTTVDLLVKAGADVNATNNARQSALFVAASMGNAKSVEALLKHGAKLEVIDRFGDTPLHALAQHKTMPFSSKNAETTLAALLNAGADVAAKNDFGRTALHEAAVHSNASIIAALLKSNAKPDAKDAYNNTPLHLACRGGRLEIAKALLDQGADARARNDAGHAAVGEVSASKNSALVKMLKERPHVAGD
ncbi:MAG: ankyrin repeat domain-containing protein [Chthoniobacterales bacterium]|nr:ankyrin repeat domain-containing protein [Chthoniobacterales bacterium]